MACDSGPGETDLWAMAAELERQFAGYKQRLAERTATTTGATTRDHDDDDEGVGDGVEEEEEDDETGGEGRCNGDGDGAEVEEDETGGDGRGGGGDVRGRMYEAYVRRKDERLRDGWHARMQRKEAEVKELWAQLQLGRAGAGAGGGAACAERAAPAAAGDDDPTTTTTTTATATAAAADGDDEETKTERNDDDRRRSSSDVALAPRRITGKKHLRTRSFSSSITTSRNNRADVGRRRSLSQEPPPLEPDASSGEAKKESPGGTAATTAATTRPRTSLRRRNSTVKGQGSAKHAAAGPKVPRSLPRRPSSSSGGHEEPGKGVAPAVVQANGDAGAPPVPSRSTECAAPGRTPGSSPPRTSFSGRDDESSGGTGAANALAISPEPDHGAVDEAVRNGEPEAKNDGVEKHGEERVDVDANGEITSDSEPEPSYVYINKDAVEEQQAMAALTEPSKLSAVDAALDVKASEETPATPAPADATAAAAEIATTNAEEAPARESSDESSLSVRSSGPSARPSCSSRDQSIERLLEADAVLVQKKREERAEKSAAAPAPRTPPSSAGSSRFSGSGTGRSPRGATVRGFKRFLSFGKKHRGREATVIDCTSPSVPSPTDDDSGSGSGRWQSTGGSVKPRMGSSDAASDDMDNGYPLSPQAACSLQSLVAASPAKSELAEIVPQEKSPKVHRSFFSFRSLNCGRG